VIVVIDGLDPSTERVLSQIDDSRLRAVKLNFSVGGSEARNVGARAACGRWIALLDDDDEWFREKLEVQLALAQRTASEKAVFVSRYIYRRPGFTDTAWPHSLPRPGQHLSEHLFDSCGGFQTSTFFCSRRLMLEVPFTKGLLKHQDWDWYLRVTAGLGTELVVAPDPLSIYWVPVNRASVTTGGAWQTSLEWAKSNRELMTKRAYSQFITRVCAEVAAQEPERIASLTLLVRECITNGSANLRLLLQFALMYSFSRSTRARMRAVANRVLGKHRGQKAPIVGMRKNA
jgi:hypothetical protein